MSAYRSSTAASRSPQVVSEAPRWVRVAAIIVGVLILLVVTAGLTGLGGDHGPGRHMGAGGAPPFSVTEVTHR